jgi:hypothetical protein
MVEYGILRGDHSFLPRLHHKSEMTGRRRLEGLQRGAHKQQRFENTKYDLMGEGELWFDIYFDI